MRQEQFVARYQAEWQAFEHWLESRGTNARKAAAERNIGLLGDEDIPARYRRLCQQLALARRRGYSPAVTTRLQVLMQRGHNLLYRTPAPVSYTHLDVYKRQDLNCSQHGKKPALGPLGYPHRYPQSNWMV